MEDIVVIIPLHDFNDEINNLLDRAIKSVPENIEIRLSYPKEIKAKLTNIKNNRILQHYVSEDKKDFASLVNQAVGNSVWFSILEFDDEYTEKWFKNVMDYIEYNPDVSIFMPLTEIYDFDNNKFMSYGNEAPWASSFSDTIGFIDNNVLQDYFDFYVTGSVFNTNDWLNYGGLKPSIKISFWYEFLLRMTYNNKKVMVIPKIGYKHYLGRTNSLLNIYKETVNETESNWWFDLAKQEYFFKNDRNKVYEKK